MLEFFEIPLPVSKYWLRHLAKILFASEEGGKSVQHFGEWRREDRIGNLDLHS